MVASLFFVLMTQIPQGPTERIQIILRAKNLVLIGTRVQAAIAVLSQTERLDLYREQQINRWQRAGIPASARQRSLLKTRRPQKSATTPSRAISVPAETLILARHSAELMLASLIPSGHRSSGTAAMSLSTTLFTAT